MKTIKVKFVGFWDGFVPENHFIYQVLAQEYDVQIVNNPEYIICSCYGTPYEYCNYPQVRIMFSGENYIPDMNMIDYAISPYPISLFDRCFYRPVCFSSIEHIKALSQVKRNYSKEWLSQKRYFANFIASHESENQIRGNFFKELSGYKRVESPGSYLYNMKDGLTVNFKDSSKTDFQRLCKFSLCFESTKHEGFVTEKITDAFYSDTIPVYYGSSTAKSIFNPKAFLDLSDFETSNDLIERIIEIDTNDDKYLEMINQPVFLDDSCVDNFLTAYKNFILSIFEVPVEKAYRRSRVYTPLRMENYVNSKININTIKSKELINILWKRFVSRIHK